MKELQKILLKKMLKNKSGTFTLTESIGKGKDEPKYNEGGENHSNTRVEKKMQLKKIELITKRSLNLIRRRFLIEIPGNMILACNIVTAI